MSDAPYPHCDPKVLHEPGTCDYCDMYPAMQAARLSNGVNFTGGSDPKKRPCPAQQARPLERIQGWYGNRPSREFGD